MKPLVSVNKMVAFRRGEPLFAPFRINVSRGDIAVVSGANGLGKSTFLDCLIGRYVDWEGDLSCPRQSVSYLTQDPQHPQTATLATIAPLVIGYDCPRYQHLLQVLNLVRKADTLPSLLSGGERQKSRILLTLLRSHSVLLLDEPFANIDAACRESLSTELECTRSDRATIVVSHPADATNLNILGALNFELQRLRH